MAAPKTLAAAKKAPKVGSWYQLLADYGDGVGALRAMRVDPTDPERLRTTGLRLQVVDLVEPGTAGVGVVDHVSPLCQWIDRAPSGRFTCHMIQFPAAVFAGLVAEADEPPEFALYVEQVSRPPDGG